MAEQLTEWQRAWLDAVLSGDEIVMRQTRRGPQWVRVPRQNATGPLSSALTTTPRAAVAGAGAEGEA
jgi:hypothetical protein